MERQARDCVLASRQMAAVFLDALVVQAVDGVLSVPLWPRPPAADESLTGLARFLGEGLPCWDSSASWG